MRLIIQTALVVTTLFLGLPSVWAQCNDGVSGNGVPIANGDSTPSAADGTDFGFLNCGPVTHNFSFTKDDTIVGPHIATVTVNPPTGAFTVEPVNHDNFPSCTPQNFAVIFTPTSTALETAVITVTVESFPIIIITPRKGIDGHNKAVSMSWSFNVQGAGQPYSVQTGTRTVLLNGDNAPTTVKGTDFGPVPVDGGFNRTRFIIVNDCSTPLNITNVSAFTAPASGIVSADFFVLPPLPTSVPASLGSVPGAAFLDVAFDPSQLGLRTGSIEFATDSAVQPRFSFAVAGTGTQGLVIVGNGNAIPDGDTAPGAADGTDFGTVGWACDSLSRSFTIRNDGDEATTIADVTTNPATDFTINPAFVPISLAPGSSTIFQVLFNPTAPGLFAADVLISGGNTNAVLNHTFRVQGNGGDGIQVLGTGGTLIPNGDSTPTAADGTDFGEAALDCGIIDRTYSIRNNSGSELTITSIAADGDFTAIATLPVVVPAGGTGTFIVRFDATVRGLRTGTVTVDCIESQVASQRLYSYAVQGTGGVGDPTVAVDLIGAWDFVGTKNARNRVRARFRVFSGGNARVPVDFYLSQDHFTCNASAALRGSLIPVTANQFHDIFVGRCSTRRGVTRFTTPVRSGYYLVAVIDPANTVVESNEDNNIVVFEGSTAFW